MARIAGTRVEAAVNANVKCAAGTHSRALAQLAEQLVHPETVGHGYLVRAGS